MRGEGFEPSRLTAYAPQTYVYTIPPPARCFAKFLSRLVPRLSLGMVSKVEPLRRSMLCKATIYDIFQKSSCEARICKYSSVAEHPRENQPIKRIQSRQGSSAPILYLNLGIILKNLRGRAMGIHFIMDISERFTVVNGRFCMPGMML